MAAIASAQIIHVPGDQPTIQAGIDAASNGDTVLVAENTYYENIDFSGKLITVASEFAMDGDTNHINNTIIDGSQSTNPNEGSAVYFRNGEDSTAVLCGFTVTGGTGTSVPADNIWTGGGIFILNANPKIIHNHIINNYVVSSGNICSGGGISVGDATGNNGYTVIRYNRISYNMIASESEFVEGGGISIYSHAILENNVVSHNEISSVYNHAVAAGIRCVGVLSPRHIQVNHNIISNNSVYSGATDIYGGVGGMQAFNCWGIISCNTIKHNEVYGDIGSLAGGLHFKDCNTNMILENNMITENAANLNEPGGIGGGVVLYASNIRLINNVLARNYAENGSGIQIHFNYDGPAQFINNTIIDNEGDGVGGALYLNDAEAVILNSILWENGSSGDEIYLKNTSSVEVAYSDVSGGWPGGICIIDEDPEFEDDSCHLNCIDPSPCIDAGTKNFDFGSVVCTAPDYDFEGNDRPLDVTYDIGADESKLLVGISEIPSTNDASISVFPNPCSGLIHLRYSIFDTRFSIFEVYSVNGVKVSTLFSGITEKGEHTMDIDLSNLPVGIYFIRLQTGKDVETAKLVLIK